MDHSSRVFLTGSCFVENIGNKLDYYKLQNLQNPFGILYHPMAIENFISKAISGYTYTAEDVFFHNERWHCFDAHSILSNPERATLIDDLNKNSQRSREYLQNTTHVIITFGTAWFYRRSGSGDPVANCHKLPQKNFTKEIMGVGQINTGLKSIVSAIRGVNPHTQIIFTISPVRHLKDGMVQNQRSKSHLISALHEFLAGDVENASYFPSYEIMMDDLRDYRFYGKDMVHPNSTAIDYIWENFVESWFSPEANLVLKQVEMIQKGLSHRPFNAHSESHKAFTASLEQKIKELQKKHPHLVF